MSFQTVLRAHYFSSVTGMIKLALKDEAPLGCTYPAMIEWTRFVALDGAYFLLSGDAFAGQRVLDIYGKLEAAGLDRVARLAGMLATLIAAGSRRDVAQAGVTGRAITRRHGLPMRELALKLWQRAKSPAPRAERTKVILFRRVAA